MASIAIEDGPDAPAHGRVIELSDGYSIGRLRFVSAPTSPSQWMLLIDPVPRAPMPSVWSSNSGALHPGPHGHALLDGERVVVDGGLFVLRFRVQRPPATTLPRSSWVTFAPWATDPPLACALHRADAGVVGTACYDEQWAPSAQPRPLRMLARDGVVAVSEDVAGVAWADVLWRTAEQRAVVDGRLLFAAAALAFDNAGARHKPQLALTWSGLVVWHARGARAPAPPPSRSQAREHEQDLAAHAAHVALNGAGCTATFDNVLARHRAQLPSLSQLEPDLRAALGRLVDAAIDAPATVRAVIEQERRALGELTTDDVRALVVNLFPDEHERHQRLIESALVIGVDGVAAQRRRGRDMR